MTARYPSAMLFAVPATVDRTRDEQELVQHARHGDRAAFEELYHRYARLVHAIILARVPVSDADDLVQDVFVSAYRKLPSLRTPEAFRGWLAAIARNRATEFHRTARRFERADLTAAEEPRGDDERAAIALDAIRKLPEAYRETLILRLVEGMTGPEIAERTGLTPDSVRVNLCRGMKLLREQLGGDRNV
jgi:RNA polymerase sigma-70 factor (ECF subfamily)